MGGGPLWAALDQFCDCSCYEVLAKLQWPPAWEYYARCAAHAHDRKRFTDMASFVAWFEARVLPRPCALRVCAVFGTESWMREPLADGCGFTPQHLGIMAVHMLRATLLRGAAVRRAGGAAAALAWRQWEDALPEPREAREQTLRVLWDAVRAVDREGEFDKVRARCLSYRDTAQALIRLIGSEKAVRAVHAVRAARRHAARARQVAVRLLQLPDCTAAS